MDESLIRKIEASKSTLKIITKTKNERLFIEKWIQHYLAIIGEEKLIIFDNMSDDEHVLSIYEKYKHNIILIRFHGYPDNIHCYKLLRPFYQALRNSTDFFTILDSDEYLYLYDEKTNKAVHDTSILTFLKENTDCDFFAPCWLENKKNVENALTLTSEFATRFNWGKPILHTRILDNILLKDCNTFMFRHTFELPFVHYAKAKTAFFIAHLKNLSLEQRIIANMNKLVAFDLLRNSRDFGGLLKLTSSSTKNKDFQDYIKETKELVKMKANEGEYPSHESTEKNAITIEKDSSITFSNKLSQRVFRSLLHRNYLDMIAYDQTMIDPAVYPTLGSWQKSDQAKKAHSLQIGILAEQRGSEK